MTFQKKNFFIFTKWKRCEFYPNFKRPITRLRRGRPGCRRFWVKAQLKGFPMSPDFGRQTVQQGPVFWLEERSHFRVFGPEIQNFEKNSNFFFSNFGNTHGALPNDAKNLGQHAFLGQIKQLWKNGRFGPWEGVPNFKGPYLGLGGKWPQNSFAGLLLVPMGSPQAPRIGVTGFSMGIPF